MYGINHVKHALRVCSFTPYSALSVCSIVKLLGSWFCNVPNFPFTVISNPLQVTSTSEGGLIGNFPDT